MKFLLDGWIPTMGLLFGSAAHNSQPRLMPAPVLPSDDAEYTVETREVAPSDLLSKIEAFSLLRKYGFREYESKEFVAGDHKWKLVISLDERWSNHISAYLVLSDTNSLTGSWEVNAIFNFFLYNQVLGNYTCFRGKVRRFNQLKSKWGFSKLISKKDFTDRSNGYLVDDSCVFGAEVFVVKNEGSLTVCLC